MKQAISSYRTVASILVALVFVTSTTASFVPLWGHFIQHLGDHNLKTVGIVVCVKYLSNGTFAFIFSSIEDKGHRYFHYVFLALGILCAAWIGFLFVTSVKFLYGVIILLGMGAGMLWPALSTIFQKAMPKERAAFGWGLWGGLNSFSSGMGALIGSHVVYYFNYNVLFITLAAFELCAFLILLVLFKRISRQEKVF